MELEEMEIEMEEQTEENTEKETEKDRIIEQLQLATHITNKQKKKNAIRIIHMEDGEEEKKKDEEKEEIKEKKEEPMRKYENMKELIFIRLKKTSSTKSKKALSIKLNNLSGEKFKIKLA